MDLAEINHNLAQGVVSIDEMFPHLAQLKKTKYVFATNFGLPELPLESGILIIRGARQYGKSTWIESEVVKTIEQFGSGSAFYLNGDELLSANAFEKEMRKLIVSFAKNSKVKRIFIDEITSIATWELILKKLADQGKLQDILVVNTGSKATDLRRGAERLPGRKGKLPRTNYLFTPISYAEFYKACNKKLGNKTLVAYLMSGGSPIACAELASLGYIPEYVIELTRDWIEGEIAKSGRSRVSLLNVINTLFRFGGTPVGQAKLAREAGLANNTVANNYIEILSDLCCVMPAYQWDQHKKIMILRKECKYHFTNLLVAIAYHPKKIRKIEDFINLSAPERGMWYEWLVAQEIVRRKAIMGDGMLDPLQFWHNKEHEIDFVLDGEKFIEVKSGSCSALEFAWFVNQFAKNQLVVINQKNFSTEHIIGKRMEEFLLEKV